MWKEYNLDILQKIGHLTDRLFCFLKSLECIISEKDLSSPQSFKESVMALLKCMDFFPPATGLETGENVKN